MARARKGGSAGDDELHGERGDLNWVGRGDDLLDGGGGGGGGDDTLIGGPGPTS